MQFMLIGPRRCYFFYKHIKNLDSGDSHMLLLYACLEVQLLCSKLGYLENYAILVLIFWAENLNSDLFYAFPHYRGARQFSLSE